MSECVLSHKLISVSRDFIKDMMAQHVDSKIMMAILLPLAFVNGSRADNDVEVDLYVDDLFGFIELPDSYKKRKNFNVFIKNLYSKASGYIVSGFPIIDSFTIDAGVLTVRYNTEAFNAYFQGFKAKKSSYVTFISDDLAKLTKCSYTWDVMKIFTYCYNVKDGKACEERVTTKNLVKYLELDEKYMREKGGINRYVMEQKIIKEATNEIAKMEGFTLSTLKIDDDGEELKYKKEYNHDGNPKKRNSVRNYLFKVSRLAVKDFLILHGIKEENQQLTEEEMEVLYYENCDCYE